jgi:hypothetical protein
MKNSFLRFRCDGCGLIVHMDLAPAEARCCPLCSQTGCLRAASGTLAQCSDCGTLIQADDCDKCGDCLMPLCSECSHANEGGACRLCQKLLDARALVAGAIVQ